MSTVAFTEVLVQFELRGRPAVWLDSGCTSRRRFSSSIQNSRSMYEPCGQYHSLLAGNAVTAPLVLFHRRSP